MLHHSRLRLANAAVERENRVSENNMRDTLVRLGIPALLILALAACSSDTPAPSSDPTASAAVLKKDCADPKWKQENLGLWYSVCRPSLRW
jgi:hypothetical protein